MLCSAPVGNCYKRRRGMKIQRNPKPRTEQTQPEPLGVREAALAWTTPQIPFRLLGPKGLCDACEALEKRFESISGKEFLQSIDRARLFNRPVFSEEPATRRRKANALDSLIVTRPQGAKEDWRYAGLLRKLKKLREAELRWLLIARWLEAEGICRAEEFLSGEMLDRLLKRASKARLQASPRDIQLARLVRIWLPYFQRLRDDLEEVRKKRRRPVEALLQMGYIQTAIESTLGRKSAVQATISWLAFRNADNGMNERTLENAYSRVEVAKREADAKFFKSLPPYPRGEVHPFEYHNFLHLIS